MERVLSLIERFRITPYFVINKYDLSVEISQKIEDFLTERNFSVSVKIPFDKENSRCRKTKKTVPSVEERELFEQLGFSKLAEEFEIINYKIYLLK